MYGSGSNGGRGGVEGSGSGAMEGSLPRDGRTLRRYQQLQKLRRGDWPLNPAGWQPSSSRHTQPPAPLDDDLGQFLGTHHPPIPDTYQSVYPFTEDLAEVGLAGLNLIVGIDFTKSNEQTGIVSFRGHSLHHITSGQNPYEQAFSTFGDILSTIVANNLISCFGFGDESTRDKNIFCFYPNARPCVGFSEALDRYRELIPHLHLSGPTSFAPIIEMAMSTVEQSGRQYHVLLIISNAQVTSPAHLSSQERKTINAIVRASGLPLSIVLVGVGDGPWDVMEEFVDKIPARAFDNFHFVNFTEIMSKHISREEAAFALWALMDIPRQYKAIMELELIGCGSRTPLPPPPTATDDNIPIGGYFHSKKPQSRKEAALMELQPNEAYAELPPNYDTYSDDSESPLICLTCANFLEISPPVAPRELCPVCFINPKDMVFGCGHQTCCDCEPRLESCPICRSPVTIRIKIYY